MTADDDREFYELMQTYRHTDQYSAEAAFETVKQWIASHHASPISAMETIRAASRFMLWCEQNGKPTDLAVEWILAEVRKL